MVEAAIHQRFLTPSGRRPKQPACRGTAAARDGVVNGVCVCAGGLEGGRHSSLLALCRRALYSG